MDANQAKTDAYLRIMKEEMIARLEVNMDANQERMDAKIVANKEKMETSQDEIKATMKAHRENEGYNSVHEGMAKKDEVLIRNDGGMSGG
jgi:hypothetical protein